MPDPRERYRRDLTELIRLHTDNEAAGLWTSTPGIIQSYNAAAQTVTVQPALKANILLPSGRTVTQALPLLVDVPVQFPAGAGHGLTFPITQGDECLVVFASRCIDAWWQSGGIQPQAEARMHDLSDGFALLGFRSKPRALSGVSTTSVQLRSDDGTSYVDLNGPAKTVTLHTIATTLLLDGGAGTVGINAPAGVVVNGPTLACTGEIEAKFGTSAFVRLTTHEGHTGSNPPTPGT